MDVRGALFALADLFMIFAGLTYGWRLIRDYKNYLLGLEWIIVGSSGVNFLIYGMLGLSQESASFRFAIFLDAFSRAVGITLILVLGLMAVTHGYKPSKAVDIGVFAFGGVLGLVMTVYSLQTADPVTHHIGLAGAIFFVMVNVLTSIFLLYFATRLWKIAERGHAVRVAVVSAMGAVIAATYDFYWVPGDDHNRTLFYIGALATWGLQLTVYYYAYRALHNHNERIVAKPAASQPVT